MADIVDRETRSRMMAGIRGGDTRPEVALRRALHRMGLRYRLRVRGLPGRPDLVFPKYRAVVFVHGCFWHRHVGCRFAYTPKSNIAFWQRKFEENVQRDQRVIRELRRCGWRVAVVWECALRNDGAHALARELAEWLRSNTPCFEVPKPSGADFEESTEHPAP